MARDDRTMPLLGHLQELRGRLLKSLLAVVIAFLPAYAGASELFTFLSHPLLTATAEAPVLVGLGPTEAFFTKLKVAFIAALFLASPALFYQLWQFVAPGLYQHEKRYVIPFVIFGPLFFVLGAGFCYTWCYPWPTHFFLTSTKRSVSSQPYALVNISRLLRGCSWLLG